MKFIRLVLPNFKRHKLRTLLTILSVIVAFVLFMAVKAMNQLRRKQEQEPASEPPPSREVQLLEEIRDALVARK